MPPLREIREDIPLLIRHLIKKHNRPEGSPTVPEVSPEAMAVMMGYHGPEMSGSLKTLLKEPLPWASKMCFM
jgi:DNA-binding NtrC family response regulator